MLLSSWCSSATSKIRQSKTSDNGWRGLARGPQSAWKIKVLKIGVREWTPVSAIDEIVSANLSIERTLIESAFCWGPF